MLSCLLKILLFDSNFRLELHIDPPFMILKGQLGTQPHCKTSVTPGFCCTVRQLRRIMVIKHNSVPVIFRPTVAPPVLIEVLVLFLKIQTLK